MKKVSKRAQKKIAWHEATEVDFSVYQVKANRFAKRVKKEGILLVHDGPSHDCSQLAESETAQALTYERVVDGRGSLV